MFRAPVGGLFRHVVDIASAQAAGGHEVGLFCDAATGGERASETLDMLDPLFALGVRRVAMSRYPARSDVMALAAARRYVRDVRPHIVHGHGSKGGVYARAPAFFEGPGRPVRVYTPHGGSFNYKPGTLTHRIYMAAERFLERRTDLFLFESSFIAERFAAAVGKTDRMVRIVPNGLDEAEFVPLAPNHDASDLVYVGELRLAKGVDTLIEAVGLIKAGGRALSLVVVGSGPDEATLKALASLRDIADKVAFRPPCPIREALAYGRITVIPSRAESLPYVVLEAAAAALPLIATQVGGIPEIFGPFAERLVPPDDPARLAEAIGLMVDMPPARRKAEAEALSRFVAGRFSLARMFDEVMDGYRSALASRIGLKLP
jgi:glycosyltransferase involved in cell wall biosynthesis